MANKKKTPGINASSMADIAFLLLIFWLTTTTMNSDKGLQRRLPPMPEEGAQQEDVKINRRNIIQVKINSSDRIIAGGEIMDISMVKDKVKEFITNPANLETMPEKEMKQIEGFGEYPVSKGVVSLQNDRGTSYNAYLQVQNELARAFNEIRDDFSRQNFGTVYNNLDEDKQKIVREAIPLSISEAEPKDRSGKKDMPELSTSSLPDIVFMILFFFMVTTQLRETEPLVSVRVPEASEIAKLERKDLASYINIGSPVRSKQAEFGTDARLQLNDSFKNVDDIRDFVAAERENLSEADRSFMTVVIRADQDVRMGIVTDVKQELRRCSALKIMYSATAPVEREF